MRVQPYSSAMSFGGEELLRQLAMGKSKRMFGRHGFRAPLVVEGFDVGAFHGLAHGVVNELLEFPVVISQHELQGLR